MNQSSLDIELASERLLIEAFSLRDHPDSEHASRVLHALGDVLQHIAQREKIELWVDEQMLG
ncbi:hypothetical protein [Ferroacidibacillus organovorans]|uniref:Uncharacterized protein n=1 Tax=Ferroacidibacillus organovorans TaxID=1765683 RepID=A0A101XTW5_9BACL|nr:hypothetical protein [Ferroacidibacillus organovorans]KUO97376.1 hypothetical protein ATW55_05765 [Ferroacidibacillus organovorans]